MTNEAVLSYTRLTLDHNWEESQPSGSRAPAA
jgi:hypothetical protein